MFIYVFKIKFLSVILIFLLSSSCFGLSNNSSVAEFEVLGNILVDDIPAFTATIGDIGNSIVSMSFEPVVYRNMFVTTESSDNKIIASEALISQWDTLKEGALDGADVYVYRVENGEFNIIREARVAEGGANASGWKVAHRRNSIIDPNARQFDYEWGEYSRPDVDYYFSIRAIYSNGTISDYSDFVKVTKPPVVDKLQDIDNHLITKTIDFSSLQISSTLQKPNDLNVVVRPDGNVSLTWVYDENVNDVIGYVIYVSDYNPDHHNGYYFELVNSTSSNDRRINAGDLVIINKKFYSGSRNDYLTNRVWGARSQNKLFLPGPIYFFPDENKNITWELVKHSDDLVIEQGETYLRVNATTKDSYRIIEDYNHSGTGQDYYQVLDTVSYTVEAWLRLEGEGEVVFRVGGFYLQRPQRINPIVFKPTSEWIHYKEEFTIPVINDGRHPGNMTLDFEGVGTLDIDNFRVYRSDTDFMHISDNDISRLESSMMTSLRTHAFIKTGRKTYDLEQITNVGGVINGTSKLNTLPQTLRIIKRLDMNPWLQIEPHFSPSEWEGLIEYLAVPYDDEIDSPNEKPWAYKRYMQGYTNPWTDYFDTVDFEIGNETWNSLFNPWVFHSMPDGVSGRDYSRGEIYGLYNEFVINIFKNSQYWDELNLSDKFNFIIGGWGNQNFGSEAIRYSPSANYMAIAAYNGGWDEGEGPPSLTSPSFFNVLNQVSQVAITVALRHKGEVDSINRDFNRNVMLGTYEAGPGYALNRLNNARVTPEQALDQERVMKSVAAGVATLDSFLVRASLGFKKQNFFTFKEGRTWSSHSHWYHGGQEYPSWALLSLFNKFAPVAFLDSNALSVPSATLKASHRRPEVRNAPLLALYPFKSNDDLVLVLISRLVPHYPNLDHDGYTNVTINLPKAHNGLFSLYYSLNDLTDNNIMDDSFNLKVDEYFHMDSTGQIDLNDIHHYSSKGFPPGQFAFLVLHDYFINLEI